MSLTSCYVNRIKKCKGVLNFYNFLTFELFYLKDFSQLKTLSADSIGRWVNSSELKAHF